MEPLMARSRRDVMDALKGLLTDVRRLGGDRAEEDLRRALRGVEGGRWYDITGFVNERAETVDLLLADPGAAPLMDDAELEALSGALDLVDATGHGLLVTDLRGDVEYHDLTGETVRWWARFEKAAGPKEWGVRGEPRFRE